MKNSSTLILFFGLLLSCIAHSQVPVAPADGNVNADMNWVMSKSYDAQGNVIGMTKNFFDNSGTLLQTQAKNMTYGHIMAAQPIMDVQGRPVATTLLAPINNSEFRYKSDFVLNSSSTAYNYKNFDRYYIGTTGQDKTNSPDAVGGQTQVGTLGWYYGNSNSWEPFTPTSSYPYSRTEYFNDGSGSQKKIGGVGDAFRMGGTHEGMGYVVPVARELDFYMQIKNKFFPLLGDNGLPTSISTLQNQAVQEIAKDVNGRFAIIMKDKGGRVLMTSKPGTGGITASNNVILNGYPYVFKIQSSFADVSTNWIRIKGGGNGRIRLNGNIIYTGSLNGYVNGCLDWNTCPAIIGEIIIESTLPFYTTYSGAYSGGSTDKYCDQCPAESNTIPAHCYFTMLSSGNVTVSGSSNFQFINQATEQVINPLPIGQTGTCTLAAGYYRLLVNEGETTLEYSNSYKDITLYFYNQRGQQVGSISPEGVKLLLNGGINNYATKNDLPFTSLPEYNLRDQLISSQDADCKKNQFIYRNDGKIRFSQNAEQFITGRFSYANFDQWGRIVESGEFQPTGGNAFTFNSSGMLGVLESVAADGGFLNSSGTKSDWIKTLYEVADNTHGLSQYVQNEAHLIRGVSMTEGPDSKTWYNYNEKGKVVWTIKWISGLGYKTTDYTYDPFGRITKLIYQANNGSETFVHYYKYDADRRLSEVRTNTTDSELSSKLQVKYTYYLHGAVKRIELGTNLQGLDYTYTLDGRLKAINHSEKSKDPGNDNTSTNGFLPDAFGEVIEYYPNDYTRSGSNISSISINAIDGQEQYGSKIRGMSWFSQKPVATISESPTMYVFKYNKDNQFGAATWGDIVGNSFVSQPGVNKETISGYDLDGDIQNLSRTNSSGAVTDNFLYNYIQTPKKTHKLGSIIQQTTGQNYATYQYDDLGQLIAELPGPAYGSSVSKYLQYDVTGRVKGVYNNSSHSSPRVKFIYDELGKRIKKMSYNGAGVLQNTTYYVYDCAGTLISIYEQPASGSAFLKELPIYGNGSRVAVYIPVTSSYRYELTDHLGNMRAVFMKTVSNNIDVVVFKDYYPFGMQIPGRGYTDATGYRYEFQGKYSEKDLETGWNAFELRMYDSKIGRWLSVDPVREHWNPYTAMGNDPVNTIDPDGGCEDCPKYAHLNQEFYEHGYRYLASNFDGKLVWARDGPWVFVQNKPKPPVPVPGRMSNLVDQAIYDIIKWFDETEFVADGNIKASFGLQAGFNANVNGVVKLDVQGGMWTVDMFTAGYSVDRSLYFDKGEQRMHNFVGGSAGIINKRLSIGGFYDYSYEYYNGYNGPQKVDGTELHDWSANLGLYDFGPKVKLPHGIFETKPGISIAVQQENGKKFYGLDVGVGVKLLLGVEVDFKLGIER